MSVNVTADPVSLTDTVQLDLPASYKYLNMIAPCITEMLSRVEDIQDRDSLIYGMQLAVQEVCTNIVDHAYGNQPGHRLAVVITLDEAHRRVVAEFRDSGASFDPSSVHAPDLVEGQVRGYGLFLIRQLVDDFGYTPLAGGNLWRLEKRW